MNELKNETSPYLLQHAENPVNWKAWNEQTLELAKKENKLIIISIGYSACHWCHVMEHDSFEDQQAADVMNKSFISIKVDREERPDVDAVYMKAVQLMGSQGGWPLNIVALPDGRPVWGGTYYPKAAWIDYLNQLAAMFETEPDKIVGFADKVYDGIQTISAIQTKETQRIPPTVLPELVTKWKKSFDSEFGGMARAPKFMMPNNYAFLMRYAFENNDNELLDFVNLTLTKMSYGGLFDTIGGGFSRYSVDMKWHVPHFEKMLYDNAQLVSLYSDAYKLTKNPLYQETVRKTLDFIDDELSNDEGGFFSALDADSLDAHGKLEEGAFYVWTQQQLHDILEEDFALFSQVFNINEFGHWENGNYVLIQNQSLESIANNNDIDLKILHDKKVVWEKMLLRRRATRNKPRLDDKSLTSWNAIMGKGFVDAYKAFDDGDYLKKAVGIAKFIRKKCWSRDGNLLHSYKDDKSTINGYLEDYAHTIEFLIALYQVTFDGKWLTKARELTDYCIAHFYDESGFFAFTSNLDPPLIARHFETEDNVIPASNSVMANNLLSLSIYFNEMDYEQIAVRMISSIVPDVEYPSAFSNWLLAFMRLSDRNRELAICGDSSLDKAMILHSKYLPHLLIAGTDKKSALPFLENRYIKGKTLYYICKNKTCDLPIEHDESAEAEVLNLLAIS